MHPHIKYGSLAASIFVILWFTTHPHIAAALVGAPLLGIFLAWLYDLIVPDYRHALPLDPQLQRQLAAREQQLENRGKLAVQRS